MAAQSQRLNVVASNLANADSATGPNGQAYKAKQVEFSAVPMAGGKEAGVKEVVLLKTVRRPKPFITLAILRPTPMVLSPCPMLMSRMRW